MKRTDLIIALFNILAVNGLYAQTLANYNLPVNKGWYFVENKGQLADENRNQLTDIKFYGHQGLVKLYCRPGLISFVFTKVEKEKGQVSEANGQMASSYYGHQASSITANRADLVLLNSNTSAQILATDQQEYYENYYTTGDADHGIINVHTYKTITYKNIYPNIDMVLHAKDSGMKYEFVVRPGGKVNDIRMQWNGLQGMEMMENGGIEYALALGKMDEGKPVSFQGKKQVFSSFTKKENRIAFKVGSYSTDKVLIIDPEIYWATYYGGDGAAASEYPLDIKTDANNNVILTGYASTSSGIATQGAYQTRWGGMGRQDLGDVYVAKFDNNGAIIWATYYGGSDDEEGLGISIDPNNNICVTGWTESTSGIATSGAYLTSRLGNVEGFLARFTSSGSLKWATYYGGGIYSYSSGYGICSDKNSYVYITGYADGDSSFASSGTHQTTILGLEDAYIAKFDSSGTLAWATYYGGGSQDTGKSIAIDANNNIYISGNTNSHQGIATQGAYESALYSQICVQFLAKFTSSGSLLWGTYYGFDYLALGSKIAIDGNNFVYITGSTTGNESQLVSSGAYQTSNAGGFDAYIARFDSSGLFTWGSFLGGTGNETISSIFTDPQDGVYLTGPTSNVSWLTPSKEYQASGLGCTSNFKNFLTRFNSSGALTLATYYEGGGDNRNAMCMNHNGEIALAYWTYCSGEATSGAHQTSIIGKENILLTKLKFIFRNDAGISSFSALKSQICSGADSVHANLSNHGSQQLDSVTISWSVNRVKQTDYKWTGSLKPDSTATVNLGSFIFSSGMDTIKAWTSNPNGIQDSVPQNDTSKTIDTVLISPSPNAGGNHSICKGIQVSLGQSAINGDSYSWTSRPSGLTSTIATPTATPLVTTTYYLTETISATGCSASDSGVITVNPIPVSNFSFTNVCPGDSFVFTDNSSLASAYKWYFGDSGSSTIPNPKHLYSSIGTYEVSLKVSSNAGCTDSIAKPLSLSNCVWPGDANDDKVVDMNDLLAIGVAYGTVGHPRPSASINWTGQPSPNWDSSFSSGVNYKFADCNGDSIVNYSDTLAIYANYGDSHPKTSSVEQGNPSDPIFNIKPLNDTITAGDTLKAILSIGSASLSVQNLYGIKFSISADPLIFEANNVSIKIDPSFLGTEGVNLIGMKIYHQSTGLIDIGLTRINHSNASGYGNFATLYLPVKSSVSQKYLKTSLGISNNNQISYNGKNAPYRNSSPGLITALYH